jgi:hypothetical protein
LKLRRRCRYYFLKYLLRTGKYELIWIAAQRKIKKEILHVETQRYTDSARVGYRANNFEATYKKYLHTDWLTEKEFRQMFSMNKDHFWALHDHIKDHETFKRGARGPLPSG